VGEVLRFVAGANLGQGLDAELMASYANAAGAKKAADFANGKLREARSDRDAQQFGLPILLDALTVQQIGADVTVKLVLASTQLDKLRKKLDALMAPPPPPPPPPQPKIAPAPKR
jgi:hypothetical protein